jgi:DNA-binding beta-propeller fold protein YncE
MLGTCPRLVIATAIVLVAALAQRQRVVRAATPPDLGDTQRAPAPRFVVDPLWPRPLPNHWLLGSATGVAVDLHDNVFVLNLPNSFNARTEVGGSTTPPTGNCCFPAPPVLEFNQAGELIGHWGGPGSGYDWPTTPSGIAIDAHDNVWIGGSGVTDGQLLEFSHDGRFIRQIGKPATPSHDSTAGRGGRGRGGVQGPVAQPPGNSSDLTSFGAPAGIAFDAAANRAYVADGYRNRRVAVVNLADGTIDKLWGAYGAKPDDGDIGAYSPGATPAKQFRAPDCVRIAEDGTIYVCDRGNDRIQLFRKDGSFVKEQAIAADTRGEGSVWDLAFSRDPAQRYLYVADGMNARIDVLDRRTLQPLTSFGDGGRYPGQFLGVHSIATDSRGNLFTAETYEGKRVQRFIYRGVVPDAPADQGTVWGAATHAAANSAPAATVVAPRFAVDPQWPKPLPHHWIIGMTVGVAVDAHDHVFIVQRPRSVNVPTESGAAANPPTAECCAPAPPVLEFDPAGNLVNSWGGQSPYYDWPNGTGASGEHGIAIDGQGNVWLGSTGANDRQILKFTHDGKFIAQFGKPAPGKNSLSTTDFAGVATMSFDDKANEAFVADGYRNRRVVVIDMTTGAVKRFWGAYGHKPDDAVNAPYVPGGPPSQQFGNPVHCAMLANDGLLYVTDRKNDRIQVFHKDGTFIKEKIIAPETLGDGSVWEVAFSRDPAQQYMYVTDGKNEKIYIMDRQSLEVLTTIGDGGRQPGEFFGVHSIATDSKGNIYTAETYEGRRLQKFDYLGLGPVAKGDQGVVWPVK